LASPPTRIAGRFVPNVIYVRIDGAFGCEEPDRLAPAGRNCSTSKARCEGCLAIRRQWVITYVPPVALALLTTADPAGSLGGTAYPDVVF
jgi:hypothetical protein